MKERASRAAGFTCWVRAEERRRDPRGRVVDDPCAARLGASWHRFARDGRPVLPGFYTALMALGDGAGPAEGMAP